jgi:hypothetical protein
LALAVIRRRRLTPPLLAIGLAVALLAAQSFQLAADGSYVRLLLAVTSDTIRANVVAYAKEMVAVWVNGASLAVAKGLYLLTMPLVAAGLWVRIRTGITSLELFSAAYIPTILVWPDLQGVRFLIPLIPTYLYYLFKGSEVFSGSGTKAVRIALAAALAVTYAVNYARTDWNIGQVGVTNPDFQSLCQYIANNTAPGDHFLFRKPRALTLFTGRAAAVPNTVPDDEKAWELIHQVKANYLVVSNIPAGVFQYDRSALKPFVEHHPEAVQQVYQNPTFTLYRLTRTP